MKFKIGMKTFTKQEVAEIFHTTVRTVERWVESGDLKGIRTAGTGNERSTIVFSEAQIEDFAELRRMKNFLQSLSDFSDDAKLAEWTRLARLAGLDKPDNP
ncbi:MAG TPA: helix-turn-helix domain-containing protein [Pyrinomonadaceae bacterium]|nr:helix-turn-helix domain-containing protein [Pyrinomonadaceae bacterium]